ncbi:hypothetical protein ACJJTC_000726 [Scirpophaga incertulas]
MLTTMWRWVVLLQATTVLVEATFDFKLLSRRHVMPSSQANCIDYSTFTDRKSIDRGYGSKRTTARNSKQSSPTYTFPLLNENEILSRRLDRFLPNAEDIVKEHAKLVQDINGLKQIVFVKPLTEESRDYEESVFHEIIEISSTPRPTPKPTVKPTTRAPLRPTRSSTIPVILLGGASQQNVVRAQPMKFSKPISLIGTSVSPLLKHPYPFVVQGTQKPLRFCMNPMHMMYSTTPRPGFLQRLLNSLFPRGR